MLPGNHPRVRPAPAAGRSAAASAMRRWTRSMTSSRRSSDSTSSQTPPPGLGQPPQEALVHRPIDAQREDADRAGLRSQGLQDLVLVADLAVRHQHENTVPARIGSW